MPEMGTSGLMSGDGKRGGLLRQYPRPSSTLPVSPSVAAVGAGQALDVSDHAGIRRRERGGQGAADGRANDVAACEARKVTHDTR